MIVSLPDPPDLMSNVRLRFRLSDKPDQGPEDVYGKVVDMDDDRSEITIRLTAVPDEVSDAIEELYASGDRGV